MSADYSSPAVTMADVARRAQVSIKTVSNVVNDYPHIRPATKERVDVAIAELGYRLNVSARRLRTRRTDLITLALPELSIPYFAELADSVIRSAEAAGRTVLIEQTSARRDKELAVLAGSRRALTDGVIFSPLTLGPEDLAAFDVDFPLVLLGERIFGAQADHVTMNNVAAARAATEHLLALGRRRIAVLGTPDARTTAAGGPTTASLRLEGYGQALEAAGIPEDPGLQLPQMEWHRLDGARSLAAALDGGLECDALFGLNDALALGAAYTLHARGMRVPEDVALIGFDDVEDVRFSSPTISSVAPGRNEIARLAVQLLTERIDRSTAQGSFARMVTDSRVLARQSTGYEVEQEISVQKGGRVRIDSPALSQ